MVFRPNRTLGLAIGGSVMLVLLAGAAFLTNNLLDTPVSLVSFFMGIGVAFLLLATMVAGFWVYGCYSLKYDLGNGALVIVCGTIRHVVPLQQIEKIVSGGDVPGWAWQKGLRWPGYSAGYAKADDVGYTLFYSSHRSSNDLLYLVTPTLAYAISPADPKGFTDAVMQQKKESPLGPSNQATKRWPVMTFPFWQDRQAQLIVLAALLLNAVLFGYVLNFYPALPELLPLHFTAAGDVDRIGFKTEVLRIPFIAMFVLVVDAGLAILLHIRERLAAYLVLFTGLFVQLLFLVAIIKIVQA